MPSRLPRRKRQRNIHGLHNYAGCPLGTGAETSGRLGPCRFLAETDCTHLHRHVVHRPMRSVPNRETNLTDDWDGLDRLAVSRRQD